MIHGIDVSSYQPETYSTTGLAFVIVKRTEGRGYVNPKASAQVAHGRAAGLLIGHYCYPHIHDGASADADYFLGHLGADLHTGDLIVLDWEWYGQAGVSVAEADAYKDQWIARAKAKLPGHRVGTYSDVSNWTHVDKNSNCGDFLWIATAGRPAGDPGIQHPWTIHQYSTAGGIDHDVAAFADKAAMAAWANPAAPKPPAPAPKPSGDSPPKEHDMQLSDQIPLGDWIRKDWPKDAGLQDGRIAVSTALGSGYGHARAAHEGVDALRAEVAELRAAVVKLTTALTKGA